MDDASAHDVPSEGRWSLRLRFGAVAAGVAALFGFGGAQDVAAQQPAVSSPNGKVSIQGGETRTKGSGLAAGSATVPVGHSFGLQLDAAGGVIGGDRYWGLGGHMFWRDPAKGLLGLFAGHGNRDGDDLTRVGAAAEYFAGSITVSGRGGYQFGDLRDGGFGRLDVKWYATDNLVVSAGGEYAAGLGYGHGGVEFQPGYSALPGLSYFLDGEAGARDHHQVLAGVRYYFGPTKSLIKRHREDDPTAVNPVPVPGKKQFIPEIPPVVQVYGGKPITP